jgi:beta-phosphoglucomutase-like phosphatase (HAD superfamily)
MTRIVAAFFDLDGTLIDREPLMQEAVRQVTHERGLGFTDDDLAPLVGRAWQDVFRALDIGPGTGWDLAAFVGRVQDRAELLVRDGFETRVLDGGVELIHRLAGRGVPVWMVTGSLRREADVAIEQLGLGPVLDGSLAAEDYARGKPDPECYRTAAERIGVASALRSRCLVVEDSRPGVAAGRAAGMRVLATADANPPEGHPSHQDLRGAHVVVPALTAVDDDVLVRVMG